MSPQTRAAAIVAAWMIWFLPFAVQRFRNRGRPRAVTSDKRARYGIILQAVGYFLAFTHGPRAWNTPLPAWRASIGLVCAAIAWALLWTSVGRLGRQWRVDAGLNADHQLVQTGAYRIVRHPIYASMFWMLWVAIAWVGTLPGWPLAVLFFIAGIEIRVRVEDALLEARFGEQFQKWQRSVPAYLPFVR